ncbi:MAG: CoA transferase, partial [Gammaproteobacteria bacterium]|nr:CoA transferase [Gammaproteobacteria bacterium]
EDLLNEAHLEASNGLLPVTLTDGERVGMQARLPALPFEMSSEKFELRSGLPSEGEHSIEVMRDAGYSADEIDEMLRDGFVKVAV